jgi:hypothetical protein
MTDPFDIIFIRSHFLDQTSKVFSAAMEQYLYSSARSVLEESWGLKKITSAEAVELGALGALENCFKDKQGELVVLLVTLMRTAWTPDHTRGAEKGIYEAGARAVIVVRGEVKSDALRLNMQKDSVVHIIRDTTILNLPPQLPVVVRPTLSFFHEFGIEDISELKKVKATAPEVELLKARHGDVIAYPPRSEDSIAPFGQEDEWTARIVMGE